MSDSDNLDSKTTSTMLAPVGNIDSYVKVINKVPMLEADDEITLAKRLREYGDLDAARKLILSHLRLVVSIARGYNGYGLPLSDLIQEGNIGLMKAVKHFDPDVGGRLASFAIPWIKSEIHDYVIRNWRMVKVATTKAQRKLFFKLRRNKKRLGWFSEKEINTVANDLGVSPTDVAEMEERLSGQDIGFDIDADDSSENNVPALVAPASYLEDENSNFALNLESNDYKNYELQKLSKALSNLDDRSRMVIQRRWLDENKATLQDLATQLRVSVERVRQIEASALQKIREIITGIDPKENAIELNNALEIVPKRRGRKKKKV